MRALNMFEEDELELIHRLIAREKRHAERVWHYRLVGAFIIFGMPAICLVISHYWESISVLFK